jgi:hypothetical protein
VIQPRAITGFRRPFAQTVNETDQPSQALESALANPGHVASRGVRLKLLSFIGVSIHVAYVLGLTFLRLRSGRRSMATLARRRESKGAATGRAFMQAKIKAIQKKQACSIAQCIPRSCKERNLALDKVLKHVLAPPPPG